LLEPDADWSADVSNFENMFGFACGCILDPKNIWFLGFDWLMRVFGTSSETSPTACSLFDAVMRQFEFNSRRIPIEKASPGAAPLDLQMNDNSIRWKALKKI
jgi:hypothetical protein